MYEQKLNTGIAANSEHFVINRMSKYASVLYNPVVYSEYTDNSTSYQYFKCALYYVHLLESILEVLNDPSFERSQPSWLRRSRQSTKGVEETDQPVEEIKTEFEDDNEGERVLLTMV